MTKTPKEMAEEWASGRWYADHDPTVSGESKAGFLAGYKAAMDKYAIKLQEANDTIHGMVDECEGLKTIIYDNEQTNLLTSGKWVSVKERLPEIPENDYSNRVLLLRADRFIVIARIEKCVRFVRPLQEALIVETDNGDPIEEFTHWQPLPKLPEEA